jgi:hypothetical protein
MSKLGIERPRTCLGLSESRCGLIGNGSIRGKNRKNTGHKVGLLILSHVISVSALVINFIHLHHCRRRVPEPQEEAPRRTVSGTIPLFSRARLFPSSLITLFCFEIDREPHLGHFEYLKKETMLFE